METAKSGDWTCCRRGASVVTASFSSRPASRRLRQLPEPGQFLVSERSPGGGADGPGVDRARVALGFDLEPLFGEAFLKRRQQPGIGRLCPPVIRRHGLAWGRPPLEGCGCRARDLPLGGGGGLCLRLEKS